MNNLSKSFYVVFVLLLSIGCDQTVKSLARTSLASVSSVDLFGGTVRLEYAENPGAFLSLGADLPESVRFLLFIGIASLALIVTLFFAFRSRQGSLLNLLGFSLIAAGGLGNIIDRVRNDGSVVDYVSITVGPIQTGIFNLADVAVASGILLVFIAIVRNSKTAPTLSKS